MHSRVLASVLTLDCIYSSSSGTNVRQARLILAGGAQSSLQGIDLVNDVSCYYCSPTFHHLLQYIASYQ